MRGVRFDYSIFGVVTQEKNEEGKGKSAGAGKPFGSLPYSRTNQESSGSVAADQGESCHGNRFLMFSSSLIRCDRASQPPIPLSKRRNHHVSERSYHRGAGSGRRRKNRRVSTRRTHQNLPGPRGIVARQGRLRRRAGTRSRLVPRRGIGIGFSGTYTIGIEGK